MGQVWSSADYDGINEAGFNGGRGSSMAVTAQNPGPDDTWGTSDDVLAPLNQVPCSVSIDNSVDAVKNDPLDRVRGFLSMHPGGANFSRGDGSVQYVNESIDSAVYRSLSTIAGGEFNLE